MSMTDFMGPVSKSSQMIRPMRVNGKRADAMVKVNIHGLMVAIILVLRSLGSIMTKEFSHGQTVKFTLENGTKGRNMAKESVHGPIERIMMGNSKQECALVLVIASGQMGANMLAAGRRINVTVGEFTHNVVVQLYIVVYFNATLPWIQWSVESLLAFSHKP